MNTEKTSKSSFESLASAARAASGATPPPVDRWNPPFCGDIDMRIARDGTWFYQSTPIGRAPLVRLFASILRKDGDTYFLVTPVEKVGITVEDAPFVADTLDVEDGALHLGTNVGDRVTIGAQHPLRVTIDPGTQAPTPYVLIRRNLEALVDRKTFYRLVELAEVRAHRGQDWFGLAAGGVFFPFMPATEVFL